MDQAALLGRLKQTFQAAGLPEAQAQAVLEGDAAASLSPEKKLALLALDANSIQRELLASPRPVTIKGASGRLEAWRPAELDRATLLYVGGGNATLLAPSADAPALAEALENTFRDSTTLPATAAWIPVSPHQLVHGLIADMPDVLRQVGFGPSPERGGFGACMDRLQLQLQIEKGKARSVPSPVAGPRCFECGLRAREGGPRCTICAARRQHGRDTDEQVRSFAELFEFSSRIAYLAIDGRRIGRLFAGQRSIHAYWKLSSVLRQIFTLDDPVERQGPGLFKDEKTGKDLFQIILCGGDDLLLVVPTDVPIHPLDLAANLLQRIEEISSREGYPDIGAGAGLVITDTLAADFCIERARALCKHAKSAIAGDVRSAIDFEVLTEGSPLSDNIEATRKADTRMVPTPLHGREGLRLTQRPYPLPRFQRLLEMARQLAAVPRTQLMTILDSFQRDDGITAYINLIYQARRSPELQEALGLDDLTKAFSAWPREHDLLLRERPDSQREADTALPDLIAVSRLRSDPPSRRDGP